MFDYLSERKFILSERRAAELLNKLARCIYYLHSYGIVHRDLKPENILMTDTTDDADLKLLDFGLSKIIGPNEKCREPYGTLHYVAPEILNGQPYDKRVDLWSLGILAYILITGHLPFNNEIESEVAKQIINNPVPYPKVIWKKKSLEAKYFVSGLLQKDPENRLNIKDVINHEWIRKYVRSPKNSDKYHSQKSLSFIDNSTRNNSAFSAVSEIPGLERQMSFGIYSVPCKLLC